MLFIVALSTSVIAVQLIPISRKAHLFNLCRNWNSWWNESNLVASNYEKEDEKRLRKAIDKENYYLQEIYKELGVNPVFKA